jgi:ABC-type thiamin/hydroxymethylpyrimidine transport system permease subunit
MDPMKPTRPWGLVAVALVAAAIGWGVVQVVDAWLGRLVPVPWLAAAALWLVAGALVYWTISSRPRLQHKPGAKPMPPLVAARTAALAMAASRIGALVAGFYAGVAVGMLPSAATPTGSSTLWSASLASLGAVVLTLAALWLEHVCRLPIGPPDDFPGAG